MPLKTTIIAPSPFIFILAGWFIGLISSIKFDRTFSLTHFVPFSLVPFVSFFCIYDWNFKRKKQIETPSNSNYKEWYKEEKPINSVQEDLTGAQIPAEQIANKIIEKAQESNQGSQFGITGTFGCGKTSLINLINKYLLENFSTKTPIMCALNLDLYMDTRAAEEGVIEEIVQACSDCFDVSEFISLPKKVENLISGEKIKMILEIIYFLSYMKPKDSFIKLRKKINKLDYHLILIIENIDRCKKNINPPNIESLLQFLRSSLDCTIIISGEHNVVDFKRLCGGSIIDTPKLNMSQLEQILKSIMSDHLSISLEQLSSSCSLFFGYCWHDTSIFSINDFNSLIETIRNFKCFLQKLETDWNILIGEVSYWELFLITLLRTQLPESYNFIDVNISTIRNIQNAYYNQKIEVNPRYVQFKSELEEHRKSLGNRVSIFDKIFYILFDQVYKKLKIPSLKTRFCSAPAEKKVSDYPNPTDYWHRIKIVGIQADELRDTELTLAFNAYLSKNHKEKLLKLISNPRNDLKFARLLSSSSEMQELTLLKILELVEEIFINRSVDSEGQAVVIIIDNPKGYSSLNILKKKINKIIFNSPMKIETYIDWIIETTVKLSEINLYAAFIFFLRFVDLNDEDREDTKDIFPLTIFPDDKYSILQDRIKESVRTITKNCSIGQFMKIIPIEAEKTLFSYLILISQTKQQLISSYRNSTIGKEVDLIVPNWLKDTFHSALSAPEYREKTLLQAIEILYLFSNPPFAKKPTISLCEKRIFSVFGEYGGHIMKLIMTIDLHRRFVNKDINYQEVQLLAADWVKKNSLSTI
ncbi:MAG: P-loop NTPase fold protein [Chlamydiales bacterium]